MRERETANESWRRAVTAFVTLLVAVGVVASLIRYLLPPGLHLSIAAPLYGSYAPEQLPVLARHPVVEAAHRIGGALYLLIGAMQLSPRLRARRPALHRWSGRSFLLLSVIAVASAFIMVVAFPYEIGERAPTLLFGSLMLAFAVKGIIHARRRRLGAHREWMMRCYAIGLGIGTIRVLVVLLVNVTALGTRQIIVPVFWAGFSLTLLAAELWIRATRRAAPARADDDLGRPGPASA